LSVIEGYITIGEEDKAKTELRSAMEGEIVNYLDTKYIVEYTDIPNGGTEVTIRPVRDFTKISYDAFQDMIEEEGEPDTYVESYDGEFVYYTNSLYNNSETIDTKDVSTTKKDFSIENDLSDTQQTVARKYEEIAEILKKERGEDNFEVVTDENGFDWYEAKIEQEDVNKPVVAFQKVAIEPNLSFETPNGEIFNNYSDALKNTNNGAIKLKIDDITLAEVSSTTDINTIQGSINDLVKQSILKGDRLLNPDGTIALVTEGNSLGKKLVNASIAEEQLKGNKLKTQTDYSGNLVTEEKQSVYEEVKSLEYSEVKKQYGEDVANTVLAAKLYEENTKPFGQNRITEDTLEITPENVLQERLLNLLNNLGVKTVSLNKYKESYQQRHGVLPSANALADIANRVIAFVNNEVTQDALTEEVAHFILEAVSQEEIAPLLENIHKTDEWNQYSEQYFEIYKDETTVRKEILGKVLKNAIQSNFAKTQQTGTANSILGRLQDFFQKFFTRISDFFTPQISKDLKEFTDKIYSNLMAESLVDELNQEQLEGNKLVLFQTSKPTTTEASLLFNKLNKALEHVESQDRRLNSVSKEEIETLKDVLKTQVDIERESLVRAKEMESQKKSALEIDKETGWTKTNGKWERTYTDESELVRATLGIANITNRQINYLDKRAKKDLLSSEESSVFALTAGFLYKTLTELRSVINNKEFLEDKAKTIREIDETIKRISVLQGDINVSQENNFKNLVDKVGDELDLTDEAKAELVRHFNAITRDTNVFYAYVGGAINAHNPALNIASAVISKAYADRDISFNSKAKGFLSYAKSKDLGFTEQEVANLMKTWKRGHYVFSKYDFEKADKDLLEHKVKTYETIFGKKVEEKALDKDENNLIYKEDIDKRKAYYKAVNEYRQKEQMISPLTEEETKKAEALYANLSERTIAKDKEFSAIRSRITRQARKNDGFSESEKFRMEELVRDRAILKNPFDNLGNLKKGLALDENDEIVIAKGFTIDTLDEDSKLTYELNLLDKLRAESFKQSKEEDLKKGIKKSIPQKFINKIKSLTTPEEKKEFIKANANINFTTEFWETFDKTEGIIAKLREKGDDFTADSIQLLSNRRKQILKANKVFNNPSEINTEDLSGENAKTILQIEKDLETLYDLANKTLDKKDRLSNPFSELVTNKAYEDILKDKEIVSLEDKLKFIKENATLNNQMKIDRAKLAVQSYKDGYIKELPKALRPFITDKNNAEEGLIRYAETKLSSYYKKLQPVGFNYETLIEDIANDPETFFNNEPINVAVTPNYIFLSENENTRMNPKFAKNLDNNEPQLRLDKYGSKEYKDYFGITDLENPVATKNVKEYNLLQALYKFQEDTIEKAGMKDRHNKYLLPQKRPEAFRRLANINKDNVKEGLKELFTFREDEAIYGQTNGEMNLGRTAIGELTIPQHGFKKMDNVEEVTDELLYSYMWMAQEAELRNSRVSALSDIESIRTILANKSYGDKHGEATETYKMFDDFVRFNMYGQSESFNWETDLAGLLSRKHNLAPLVKKFQWWIRLANLGFSVLTPLTSFLQGSTNFMMEKFVGERIDKDASRLAIKQMVKLFPESMSDVMQLTSKSKLNVLSEFMGQSNSLERFKNSNYGKLARGAMESAYMTHAMADAPLSAQVLLTVLHDFRVVNYKLVTFSQFREENKSLSKKEARVKWASYENEVLYNYIDIKDGVAQISDKLRNKVPNIDKRMQNVRNSISVAKQEVDSQIPSTDRTKMQRHALLSFLTLHKGWLITSMTRRFKSEHLNLYTGLQEEGSYSGFGSYFKDFITNFKKEKNPLKAWNDTWKDASITRRRSMQRVAADVVVTNSLVLIALLLRGAADDDDDKDFVTQFSAYMSYRLANEVTSQSTAFGNQVFKFLESPTTGLSQMQNIMDVFDLASSKAIESGQYKGQSESSAWMFKSLPVMKEYWKLTNMDKTRKSYIFYNKTAIDYFSFAGMAIKANEEEK